MLQAVLVVLRVPVVQVCLACRRVLLRLDLPAARAVPLVLAALAALVVLKHHCTVPVVFFGRPAMVAYLAGTSGTEVLAEGLAVEIHLCLVGRHCPACLGVRGDRHDQVDLAGLAVLVDTDSLKTSNRQPDTVFPPIEARAESRLGAYWKKYGMFLLVHLIHM